MGRTGRSCAWRACHEALRVRSLAASRREPAPHGLRRLQASRAPHAAVACAEGDGMTRRNSDGMELPEAPYDPRSYDERQVAASEPARPAPYVYYQDRSEERRVGKEW